ncbi:MAG TPA: 4Fe-4S dicluster domain-containing protein [Candidatus Eisenbacteria bacterium]|nr:4Fe-4S dicluster domain-containing protein [Candidatus Eisenbacteria bacterium]
MAPNWGFFLCNCRGSIPLDLERLVLPTAPSVLSVVDDPGVIVHEVAGRAPEHRPDRVMICCCAEPSFFHQAFETAAAAVPKFHFLDLKQTCFAVHGEAGAAHEKATRLLRAAVRAAELTVPPPSFNPLTVGARVLIATDSPSGKRLAEKIADEWTPIVAIPPDASDFEVPVSGRCVRGRVAEINGRLGSFQVAIEAGAPSRTRRVEVQADQVVIVFEQETPSFRRRTGLHLLAHPTEADLDRIAERMRDLRGEFLKPVHVTYDAAVCAGGTANQEACGVCITACPYEAVSRDPENHLRMKVDHMACEGCGACVSACPTSALRFTEPSPEEIYARLGALLQTRPNGDGDDALAIVFHCGEQGRRALDEAGRNSIAYPARLLPIEVPCLRYVSEANMLAAFALGAAGVALLGCEQCQHGERALLYDKIDFCNSTLEAFGLGAARLSLVTAGADTSAEAIAALTKFGETLNPTPIPRDRKAPLDRDNRQVIADAIRTLIDASAREPGRRPVARSQPFAFAEVKASGCTMCRSCVNVCPTHAFRLDEGSQSLEFKHISCIACGLCEGICPENVITLRPEIHFNRDALTYKTVVQDRMVDCVKCGKPYINQRALDAVEARVFSLESLLDTFSGARRNLLRMCPDCRGAVAMLEVEKGWKP